MANSEGYLNQQKIKEILRPLVREILDQRPKEPVNKINIIKLFLNYS